MQYKQGAHRATAKGRPYNDTSHVLPVIIVGATLAVALRICCRLAIALV